MKELMQEILNLSSEYIDDIETAQKILYEIYIKAEKALSEKED